MTLGRPAVCSTRSALRPFSRAQAATCSAMRVSPAAPAISAGLTESIDTSAVSRSTTSSLMEILLSVGVGRPALGAQQHDYGLVADAELTGPMPVGEHDAGRGQRGCRAGAGRHAQPGWAATRARAQPWLPSEAVKTARGVPVFSM